MEKASGRRGLIQIIKMHPLIIMTETIISIRSMVMEFSNGLQETSTKETTNMTRDKATER